MSLATVVSGLGVGASTHRVAFIPSGSQPHALRAATHCRLGQRTAASSLARRAGSFTVRSTAAGDVAESADVDEEAPKKEKRTAKPKAPKEKKPPPTEEEIAAKEAEKVAKAAAKKEEKAAAKKAADETAQRRTTAAASRRSQRNTARGNVPELDMVTTPGGAVVPKGKQWYGMQVRSASASATPPTPDYILDFTMAAPTAPASAACLLRRIPRLCSVLIRSPAEPRRSASTARSATARSASTSASSATSTLSLRRTSRRASAWSSHRSRPSSLASAPITVCARAQRPLSSPHAPLRLLSQVFVARYPTEDEWKSRKKEAENRAPDAPPVVVDADMPLKNSGPPVVEGLVLVRRRSCSIPFLLCPPLPPPCLRKQPACPASAQEERTH